MSMITIPNPDTRLHVEVDGQCEPVIAWAFDETSFNWMRGSVHALDVEPVTLLFGLVEYETPHIHDGDTCTDIEPDSTNDYGR